MRRIFKSKLFWVSVFICLISAVYSAYLYASYSIDKFYSMGSEGFALLSEQSDELYTVTDALYAANEASKESRDTPVAVFLFFYITIVFIVATWKATKLWQKKGKKIILRISSFILGPIVGVVGMVVFGFLPRLGVDSIAQFAILRKADVVVHELTVQMKSEEGRMDLRIISNEEEIVKRIKENPAVPVIINDDDSFTSNLIIAAATIGKDKTAFEAVAIPQAVWRKPGGNVLLKELGTDQLLLPGHILAIRDLTPEFGRKLLPIIGDKIIRHNKLMRAKISESGKGAPQYVFLAVEDFRKLREARAKKDQQRFIDTINIYKGYLARGVSNAAEVRQWLAESEDAYQRYLEHPVVGVNEFGVSEGDEVQVLLVDENNIPSDISGYARYFLSPLATTVHELLHYYSNSKAEIPSSLEEAMTGYYGHSLSGGANILMDSGLSLDYFTGYTEERKIVEELAKRMSEGDLATLYFSGNEKRFAKAFEEKYSISYEDFIRGLDKIFYASSEEKEKFTEDLLIQLKSI